MAFAHGIVCPKDIALKVLLTVLGSKVPGAPFAEYVKTGNLGRFLGFLACLIQASFTIAGMSKSFASTQPLFASSTGQAPTMYL